MLEFSRTPILLQFITQRTPRYTELQGAQMALEGGCRWIQLRMKDATPQEIISVGKQMRRLCDMYGATFILDDHVELVAETAANGVHLGLSDMPIDITRKKLGNKYIIGGTANCYSDIAMHYQNSADYIGCGPFRFTTTKKNLAPTLGISGYADIISQINSRTNITIPKIAIGGIDSDAIVPILNTGMDGVALSGSILRAKDPVGKMQEIVNIINNKTNT